MTLSLDRAHAESALLRVIKPGDLQSGLVTPAADFFFRMAPGITRMVPVKVDVIIFFERKSVAPVQFGKVPVDQSLQVVAALLYSEQRHVFGHLDLGL